MISAVGRLSQGITADSAVRPSLGVEVAAACALIVHLARKCAGDYPAQNQDPSQNNYGQQSVGESLHALSTAARPLLVMA